MQHWIVTALGKDQPGIVSGVTKVLYNIGCNLEDSEMTQLGGEFTIMLAFSSKKKLNASKLEKAFAPIAKKMKLSLYLKSLTAKEARSPRHAKPYIISVYGKDRRGIVYKVSEALAKAKVNITDVHTHRSPSTLRNKESSLYMLILEVELKPRQSLSSLQRRLKSLARSLKMEASVRPYDTDVL